MAKRDASRIVKLVAANGLESELPVKSVRNCEHQVTVCAICISDWLGEWSIKKLSAQAADVMRAGVRQIKKWR